MPLILLGRNNPDCPLCKKPFEAAETLGKVYYFCRKDEIQIFANDPMMEKWTNVDPETEEAISCCNPQCGSAMRVFTRSDGFMKAKCPEKRCGAEIATEAIPDAGMVTEKGKAVDATDGLTKRGINATKNWKHGNN